MNNRRSVIGRVFDYLELRHVGLLEITFALAPMLGGFSLASFPMSLLIWVVLFALLLLQGKLFRAQDYRPFKLFVIFWVIHELAMIFIDDVNVNGLVSQFLYMLAVFALYPNLDIRKLRGSLNWVALISLTGLLFQWSIVMGGGMVHPLEIPGLTMSEFRLTTLMARPSAFFMEPAAYVTFMICPLLFALTDRKYIWAAIIILSMFLTTSTTGIIVSFMMLFVSVLSARHSRMVALLSVLIIGGGLYFALTRVGAFNYGLQKMESIDYQGNTRLNQGRYVVSSMKADEFVLGAPYSTPYRYCKSGRAPKVTYYGESVFMPSFWYVILRFGIIGLVLYLNVYWQILRRCRLTAPLIAALIANLFSSSFAVGDVYAFTLIILLVFMRHYEWHESGRELSMEENRV